MTAPTPMAKPQLRENEERTREGPGETNVGPLGITAGAVFLLALAVVVTVLLVQIGSRSAPPPAPTSGGPATVGRIACDSTGVPLWATSDTAYRELSCVRLGLEYHPLWADERLLLLVLLCGALGGLVHALRSYYWYVGNRDLRRSWLLMYGLLPIVGALLAAIVYFLLRGGLVTGAGVPEANPFGFAALAALTGLFTSQAAEKLKEVFTVLLARAEKGKDQYEQAVGPEISKLDPATVRLTEISASGLGLEISGKGFAKDCKVRVAEQEIDPVEASETRVMLVLPSDVLAAAGDYPIRVVNLGPPEQVSGPMRLRVV
jgi:hypothetical protein